MATPTWLLACSTLAAFEAFWVTLPSIATPIWAFDCVIRTRFAASWLTRPPTAVVVVGSVVRHAYFSTDRRMQQPRT